MGEKRFKKEEAGAEGTYAEGCSLGMDGKTIHDVTRQGCSYGADGMKDRNACEGGAKSGNALPAEAEAAKHRKRKSWR